MLNLQRNSIENFISQLRAAYQQSYSLMEPQFINIIEWTGRLALENIANSDALYHNVEHTMLVTSVGQTILKGKHIRDGGVTPKAWMHYTIALLCHDIGYLRNLFAEDKPGEYLTGIGDETVRVTDEGTDAILAPYHVDRSICFIRKRFGRHTLVDMVDPDVICSYIEMTRFPIPDTPEYKETKGLAGLARAADFIGQLGDPNYLRKIPALYYEFEETGENQRSGYKSPGHLRECYTQFYWDIVYPYISDAIEYLSITQEGKLWTANLYAHVHQVEHADR